MGDDQSSTEYARAHMSRTEWRMMLRAKYEVWIRREVARVPRRSPPWVHRSHPHPIDPP